MKSAILVAAVHILAFPVFSIGHEAVPRQRIGLRGAAAHGAIGRLGEQTGSRGDLFILSSTAEPGESITVGVYLYCRDAVQRGEFDLLEGVGEWRSVPVNNAGGARSYFSRSLQTAGVSVDWRNKSTEEADQTFQLFVPYWAIGLQRGNYEICYRVRVWANRELMDDYYTDERRFVFSSGSTWKDIEYTCAMSEGPKTCQFMLQGTTDSLDEEALP